jgi:hypothetical protein
MHPAGRTPRQAPTSQRGPDRWSPTSSRRGIYPSSGLIVSYQLS